MDFVGGMEVYRMVLEREIEQKLVNAVKAAGGLCPKFAPPGSAGMPDRLVLFPGGKTAFVEVKAPGKKPRPLQIKKHKRLEALGFRCYVLDDEKKIEVIISDIQTL